jgi:hypothetical protein
LRKRTGQPAPHELPESVSIAPSTPERQFEDGRGTPRYRITEPLNKVMRKV